MSPIPNEKKVNFPIASSEIKHASNSVTSSINLHVKSKRTKTPNRFNANKDFYSTIKPFRDSSENKYYSSKKRRQESTSLKRGIQT
jgi:hypothetical protein